MPLEKQKTSIKKENGAIAKSRAPRKPRKPRARNATFFCIPAVMKRNDDCTVIMFCTHLKCFKREQGLFDLTITAINPCDGGQRNAVGKSIHLSSVDYSLQMNVQRIMSHMGSALLDICNKCCGRLEQSYSKHLFKIGAEQAVTFAQWLKEMDPSIAQPISQPSDNEIA